MRNGRKGTDLPGTELKSPQTSMGMSALTAIFSSPFKRVWTWKAGVTFFGKKIRKKKTSSTNSGA